jgi:hypothetical protein
MDAKKFRVLYSCGIPFNVLRSPYWHEMVQAINGAKGYKSLEYDKAKTLGLHRERAKIHIAQGQFTNDWIELHRERAKIHIAQGQFTNDWIELHRERAKIHIAQGQFTNDWIEYGVSIVSDGSTHDYSKRYKSSINIADPLIKTIQEIRSYNVIQVTFDNVANCKATEAIIKDMYPNIFWSRYLLRTLNLLMHDIIKIKDHDYKWIGALYKRAKKMIKFITNSVAQHIFHNHSKLELLKIAKTTFASYYLTIIF